MNSYTVNGRQNMETPLNNPFGEANALSTLATGENGSYYISAAPLDGGDTIQTFSGAVGDLATSIANALGTAIGTVAGNAVNVGVNQANDALGVTQANAQALAQQKEAQQRQMILGVATVAGIGFLLYRYAKK